MARKVLISFLGTGSPHKDKDPREYREATYGFYRGYPNGEWDETISTPFIAAALRKHFGIDRLFIIGTVMSMWDTVYWHFNNSGNSEHFDINTMAEIEDFIQCRLKNPLLPQGHTLRIEEFNDSWLTAINTAINGEAILIKYGLSKDEILFNQERILELSLKLQRDDELYIDLTHGFRSLPMYLMNVLIYLQNVRKDIKIKCVTYGMLDVSKEFNGVTPVVELTSLLEVSQWITGAYAFQEFGNAYQISSLMQKENANVAERLKRFSDLLNLNHLSALKNEVQNLSGIKNASYATKMPELIISPMVNLFIRRFRGATTNSGFQYRLARWQFEHKNYTASLLTLTEAIVSLVCEINHKLSEKITDPIDRSNAAKAQLRGDAKGWKVSTKLSDRYNEIVKMRNSIAHLNDSQANYREMISAIKTAITELQSFFDK